mgnify:CR=1 FL=1
MISINKPYMLIDKILQIFVTKELKFFPLYLQSAENIQRAANFLVEMTKTEDQEERRILSRRIKECEVTGDTITDKIIDELLDAFVTPFDRDDVHLLAEEMDNVMDMIRDTAKKFSIYQPKTTSSNLTLIAQYIAADAGILVEISKNLDKMREKPKWFDDKCDEIKENEHICDDIYERYMSTLFESETDPIELVRKKNILQALEDTSDAAKHLSGSIRSIVVKMG